MKTVFFLFFMMGLLGWALPSNAQTESPDCQRDQALVCASAECSCVTLRIDALNPLSFGRFSSSEVGGSITVRPDGGHSLNGRLTMVGNSDFSPAKFRIYGPAQTKFRVILPALASLNASGSQMQMRDLTLNQADKVYIISSSGYVDIWVGATLFVPSNLNRGSFDGSFSLDLEVIK